MNQNKIDYSSWNKWNPKKYLEQYFHVLGKDSIETLKFINRELKKYKKNSFERVLDFGAGPTLIVSLAVCSYAKKVHLSEYLSSNLKEVNLWLNNDKKKFDWSNCTEEILKIETNNRIVKTESIKKRHAELKKKIKIFKCDASKSLALGKKNNNKYPLILAIFCADSATGSKLIWRKYMKNIINLLEPSGILLLAALKNCKYYKIGDNIFPSANINEKDVYEMFIENKIIDENIKIETSISGRKEDGFDEIIFATAKR